MSRRAESIGAVAALSDTLRRRLYDFIRAQSRPVSRDEAAEHVGISRRLAAFHLDKLTRSGLLRSHYGRPAGAPRSPGRAPKLYQPADVEFEVAIPARQYDLIGQILLDAVSAIDGDGDTDSTVGTVGDRNGGADGTCGPDGRPAAPADGVTGGVSGGVGGDAALRAAAVRGAALGADARVGTRAGRLGPERAFTAAATLLETLGYEPVRAAADRLCLRNCPFHRLAVHSPELVCGINRAFVEGLLDGLGAGGVCAVLVPDESGCCVQVRGTGR
ncbi:MAG TPA: helix-turn-helix domain-containing protein [Mycobacteriales bacterium]|nr:helix-turn-helix domain-containing protein [Mycobacteriales bacterium]